MLEASEVISFLEDAARTAKSPISAFWIPTSHGRDDLEVRLRQHRFDVPVIPIVIRKAIFADSNAVLSELVGLMDENREQILAGVKSNAGDRASCILALLAKSELRVAQLGSPVTLPEWFPIRPGHTFDIIIQDVTWQAREGLNSRAISHSEICSALMDLEGALINRLACVVERDHNQAGRLLELFRSADANFSDYKAALQSARVAYAKLANPTAFRPSLRQQHFIVERLSAIGLATPPAKVDSVAKALVDALGIPSDVLLQHESILSVLCRPQPTEAGAHRRLARCLLASVLGAYQLLTASAHADSYSSYPVLTLKALSYDIRQSLQGCQETIANLQ